MARAYIPKKKDTNKKVKELFCRFSVFKSWIKVLRRTVGASAGCSVNLVPNFLKLHKLYITAQNLPETKGFLESCHIKYFFH